MESPKLRVEIPEHRFILTDDILLNYLVLFLELVEEVPGNHLLVELSVWFLGLAISGFERGSGSVFQNSIIEINGEGIGEQIPCGLFGVGKDVSSRRGDGVLVEAGELIGDNALHLGFELGLNYLLSIHIYHNL